MTPGWTWLNPATSWRGFLVLSGGVLTLLFTLLRPEASHGLGPVALFLFWAAHVFGALLLLELAQVLLSRTPVMRLPTGVQLLAGGALGASFFAPLAFGLDWISGLSDVTDDRDEGVLGGLLGEFSGSAVLLIVSWVALNSLRMLRLPEFTLFDMAPTKPEFMTKVPAALGEDLVSLQAELHYTRVRTTNGECLILHAFGDAVSQLDESDGQQVHRSFWASYRHIQRLEREGQGGLAHMSDGSFVRVSRRHFRDLQSKA